ncbi:MAG: (2Fe-2S)-binding protein [Candidatus Eisenbacteria bacterium]|nr:(2Fe-2S)-binding protein [Candidatus Eisenbacteria bacterium]
MPVLVSLKVNGEERRADVPSATTLVELLRDHLGLTGTKVGCGRGDCGACTVLIDGEPANACLVFAAQCEGRDVTTIEGLAPDGNLDRIQSAFVDAGAVQCGFCTPGMIMSAYALLSSNPTPTRGEAAEAVSGNLCRCTGYVKIVDAILGAAESDSSRTRK